MLQDAPAPPLPSAPPVRPLDRMYRIIGLWKEQLAPALKEHGLTVAHFHVLAVLRQAGPFHCLTTGQLAAGERVTGSGMTARANQLERKGLIARERDQRDRRIIHLRLTERGLHLVDQVIARHHLMEQRLMAGLDEAEHRALAGLLTRLEHFLEGDDGAPRTDPDPARVR
ncbi:MarR family winged helix-turn-helix transcriptional regulator [Kitasatospora sp. NPDC058444]|uniref:MarR family winged helix-turn-helix transcriptional regulator n=1 Tax=Kitasatospora sp. NPDC058444 TaxID=3346504 RepID=UPI003664AD79